MYVIIIFKQQGNLYDNIKILKTITLNYNMTKTILKTSSVTKYGSTALANFQFKIITKILADRLVIIAPKIVSEQQRGFIKGHHISDFICIASEAVNMLDSKCFGGNVVLKFDIRKAFDTIDWCFSFDVWLFIDNCIYRN